MADLTATTKSGYAASRRNYLAELLIERLTGVPTEHYQSREMEWGTEHEPEARALYQLRYDIDVETVGYVQHPQMDYAGASPDGLAGDDGAVEIKCPNTATHIETLRTQTIPRKYRLQMQWVMECTGRSWCDYISYDPRMRDPRLTLYVQRVGRDEETIAMLRAEVEQAEAELQSMQAEIEQLAEQIA
jgi:putative phage-type endonuclease